MIGLDDVDRRAVVRGKKTAHLYPVPRSGARPFSVGEVHTLHRVIPDPLERDAEGKLVNVALDGTPHPAPPVCSVRITECTEIALGDLVKADAIAMGKLRIADVARWWMDERRPSWRKAYEAGEHIGTEIVLQEFRRRWHHRTAWLVRWERVDNEIRVLAPVGHGNAEGKGYASSGDYLDAGECVPEAWQTTRSAKAQEKDEKIRLKAVAERVEQAEKLITQFDTQFAAIFAAPTVGYAEKRQAKRTRRRVRHDLVNRLEKIKATAS